MSPRFCLKTEGEDWQQKSFSDLHLRVHVPVCLHLQVNTTHTDTHRHRHTHTIRLRAHCSSIHTSILSPIFGTRFAQTQLFWGERREDGGRGGLFSFFLPISCLSFPLLPPLQGGWVHGKLKDTLGHVQKTPVSLSSLCSPVFCCWLFIYFCLCKDKLLSWLYILCFHIPLYLWLC